jgi:hypothetical protein
VQHVVCRSLLPRSHRRFHISPLSGLTLRCDPRVESPLEQAASLARLWYVALELCLCAFSWYVCPLHIVDRRVREFQGQRRRPLAIAQGGKSQFSFVHDCLMLGQIPLLCTKPDLFQYVREGVRFHDRILKKCGLGDDA